MTTSQRFSTQVCLVATTVASLVLGHGHVVADEVDPKAQAQALFLEGRAAIDANDWDTGCPKVRRSLEVFAVANSHFTVALCDEREGHIAAALEHWERGLGLVEPSDQRAKVAKERIAALDPRVPRIRVVTPPGAIGASIWLDDVQLTPAIMANPVRVDPGKHVLVVRKKGREDNRREILLEEKERTEFVATIGEVAKPDSAPVSSATTAPVASSSSPPIRPKPPMHPRKFAGFVIGGVGVASLLVSAGTGIGALEAHGALEEQKCGANGTGVCPKDEVSSYKGLFAANAVTFGVGLAGVAAGVVLILTAPKNSGSDTSKLSLTPIAVPNGNGIALSGRF
ncbi:MAG TPA: hypothetical protein PK156_29105 [Polyangium sp.]|nr:hypothetical protein [Polyangium sp.]